MRLVTTLVAALLATTTVTAQIAEACGGYTNYKPAPRVHLVSSHGLVAKGAGWTTRSFVVLDEAFDGDADGWRVLAPGTYDPTQIRELSPLSTPMELTLIGESGVRVIKTAKRVALTRDWHIGIDKMRVALELPAVRGRFSIAIPGRVAAKWHELGFVEGTAATSWWLAKRGVKPDHISLRPLDGTGYELVEFYDGAKTQFAVRQGDRDVGTYTGQAIGAVTVGGRLFVITRNDDRLGTLELAVTRA